MPPKLTIQIFAEHYEVPPAPSLYHWVLYKGNKPIARNVGSRLSEATARADAEAFLKHAGIAATISEKVEENYG